MPAGRPKDLESLSKNPKQQRIRLRRAAKRAQRTGDRGPLDEELQMYGIKPVEEWDVEELAHGRPRHPTNGFKGRKPTWITADVTREAKRRLHGQVFGALGAHAEAAVRTIYNLMVSEEIDEKGKPIVDARTKLAASTFILEHVLGKPTTIVEIDATDSARQMFAAAIVLDDGLPQGHLMADARVIDGIATEREPDPDLDEGEDDDRAE